jgi:pyruvate/2-oxoglutarate dehydrogenase complex dihydrolipoamide acyltransferase (E2) component
VSSSPTDQLVRVEMPQMGVSVAEGTIVEWRKRTGDWVAADEPICDITTDKIDVEVPSPSSGRVERILVEPGETVSVGTPLAEINPGAKPGEAHPEEDVNGARTQGTGAPADEQLLRRRTTASRTARAFTRRSCGGSPTSTGSTCRR